MEEETRDKETSYAIVRANTLQDLDEAFSCGLIKLYQDIFADQPLSGAENF